MDGARNRSVGLLRFSELARRPLSEMRAVKRVPLYRLEEAKKVLPAPNPDNMVPIYSHTKTHIWLWLGTPQSPTLVKFTHAKVKTGALKAVWPSGGGMPFAGQIDPAAYSGPADIQPIGDAPAAAAMGDGNPAVASVGGPPQSPPLAASGSAPLSLKAAVPKLLYPIPPNFVRDNSQGWVKFGGAADGLPGKWFDVAAKSGVNAFYTPEGNVLTATTPYAMLWSASQQGVPKLTGAASAEAWDAGVPKSLVAKLPAGFRASYLKANNYGDILGMMDGAPALAHPADSTYVLLSDFNTPISYGVDTPTPKAVVADVVTKGFAFGWPTPPNWSFEQGKTPEVDVDTDGVQFVRGWWWSENGAYQLAARFRADGVIEYGAQKKRFELAKQGIQQKSTPYEKQVTQESPFWAFKISGEVPMQPAMYLGMIGGEPWLWDGTDNTFRNVVKDGKWRSLETMLAMHAGTMTIEPPTPAPAKPIPAPSDVKVVSAPPADVSITNTKFAFGWPIPPNFVPNSPVVIKDAGKKSARIEGTWYGPQDDFPAGMYSDGKIMDLEDEETFFDLKKEGVKQGASYESQVTLPNKPAWFAVTKTNEKGNKRALGMVGSIPFEWNYKPGISTPWKNILANDFHTTADMEMEFGNAPKTPSEAPVAASSDVSDDFAFGWPIPPNFVPKKPFEVELPGTNHAALQGTWHGLKKAVAAEFTADGDVLGAVEAEMLHSLALDDIEKGKPYEKQMKVPNKPAWFHASSISGTKVLGMVAGQAWQFDTKPGVAKPFKNGAGDSLTLADMEAKYGAVAAAPVPAPAVPAPGAAPKAKGVTNKVVSFDDLKAKLAATADQEETADEQFAFGWPYPPNFVPKKPVSIKNAGTNAAYVPGTWYGVHSVGVQDAGLYMIGDIVDPDGDGAPFFSLKTAGIKKGAPFVVQGLPSNTPSWFAVTMKIGNSLLGMVGATPFQWHFKPGTDAKAWKNCLTGEKYTDAEMHASPGAPVSSSASASKSDADEQYAFGWPYPPNFVPNSPVEVKNPGSYAAHVPGTWFGMSGPTEAGAQQDGKIRDLDDGHVWFDPLPLNIQKGEPFAPQVAPFVPAGKPDWFAFTMKSGLTSALGMVGKIPFTWNYKPGVQEPWKNLQSFQVLSDEDMQVEYGGGLAKPSASKVYVDDNFAFDWPIPPNFVPNKPFNVHLAGTPHASLSGKWHTHKGVVNADFTADGDILDAVEGNELFSLSHMGIKKSKLWSAQVIVPEKPDWFHATTETPDGVLGMAGGKAFMWDQDLGSKFPVQKFLSTHGAVLLKDMEAMYGSTVTTAPVVTAPKPTKAKATKTAVPKPDAPMSPIMDASKIPDLAGMKKLGSGKSQGLGGAGEKDVYQDSDGKKFLFKPAFKKGSKVAEPYRALAQEVFSSVAMAVRPEHIPITTRKVDGVVGTVQPMIALATPATIEGTSPKDLTPTEMLDLASDHVLDWVTSQHDTHSGNVVRTKDGRLLTVDKEQGFRYFGTDSLSVDYHPNAAYGEKEPYYNTFWRDFADGKFDFDPQELGSAFAKLRAMDTEKYADQLRVYAESLPQLANDAYGRDAFVKKALGRRNTAKRDFEKFLTGLYKKRTGDDGKFTFATGWNTGQVDVKKKKITYDFAEWAALPLQKVSGGKSETVYLDGGKFSFVIRLYPYDSQEPNAAEMITFKFAQNELEKAKQFCSEFGIKIVGTPVQGSAYSMLFVNRKQLASLGAKSVMVVIHDEAMGVPSHTGVAEYLPDLVPHPAADPNVEALDVMHKNKTLGFAGKRIFLDSDLVENQTATVRRMKYQGKNYLQVQLKIRGTPSFHGESAEYPAHAGSYVAGEDMIDTTGGTSLLSGFTSGTVKKVVNGQDMLFGYEPGASYALRNMLIAFITGSNVRASLKPLLTKMLSEEAAEKIVSQPTEADRRVLKAWRLLNALDPQKHDSLRSKGASEKTVLSAIAERAESGAVDVVREVDVVDGHMGHVLPGRWQAAKTSSGQPKLRFVFHATSVVAAVPSVLKGGLAGAAMRIYSGAFGMGSASQGAVNGGDFSSGGADTVQCRVATASNGSQPLQTGSVSGSIQFIIAPDVVDRLDVLFHMSDSYGCTNPDSSSHGHSYKTRMPVQEGIKSQDSNYKSSAEMVFNRGIHANKILRVTCSSSALRAQILKACYAANVNEHLGVPIEDFVVVETQQGPTYEKYVKPAGY